MVVVAKHSVRLNFYTEDNASRSTMIEGVPAEVAVLLLDIPCYSSPEVAAVPYSCTQLKSEAEVDNTYKVMSVAVVQVEVEEHMHSRAHNVYGLQSVMVAVEL